MIMMVLETIRIEIEISEFIFFRFVSYLIEKKHATITLILNERTNERTNKLLSISFDSFNEEEDEKIAFNVSYLMITHSLNTLYKHGN